MSSGVCVIASGNRLDANVKNFRITMSFLEEDMNCNYLYDMLSPDNDKSCQNCSLINKTRGMTYLTDHCTSDCLRCVKCNTWMKTRENCINHVGNCQGRRLCKFFASGFCKNGESCEFSHTVHQANHKEGRLIVAKKQRNIFKREKCCFFYYGQCKEGEICRFKHGANPCNKCGGFDHNDRHCSQCFECWARGHLATDCSTK